MAYTTIAEVRAISGFTDDTKVSDAKVTAKITMADSIINSIVGRVYQLPLSSTPGLIAEASAELAKYGLYMDEYGEETQNLDKGWEKGFNFMMEQLGKINAREMILVDDTTGEELTLSGVTRPGFFPTNASSSETATDSTAPKFTMNKQF